jgi:DNA mismatch repair protein MutS
MTLTRKTWTLDNGRQADLDFAGFPISALGKHLRSLVDRFGKVVIMDETGDKVGRTGKEREVTRIATPATLLDDGLMDASEPSYLLAAATRSAAGDAEQVELAWVDSATGDCYSQFADPATLMDDLMRISPCEIIAAPTDPIRSRLAALATQLNIRMNEARLVQPTPSATSAVALLSQYLRAAWPAAFGNLEYATEAISNERTMHLDANAFAALELRSTSRRSGSRTGSLIHSIKRTITPGGGRLLLSRISAYEAGAFVIVSVRVRQARRVPSPPRSRHVMISSPRSSAGTSWPTRLPLLYDTSATVVKR